MVLGVLRGPHARPSSTLSLPGLPHRNGPCDTMLLPNASSPSSNNSLLLKPRIGIMSIRAIDPGSFSAPFTFASSICRRLVRSVTGSSRAHGQSWCSHLIGRLQSYLFTAFFTAKKLNVGNFASALLRSKCIEQMLWKNGSGSFSLTLSPSLACLTHWQHTDTHTHTPTRLWGCLLRIGVM